jgi:predicted RNase H-like HicB family nuclease
MIKYTITIQWSEEDNAFLFLAPAFTGLSAFGDTYEEALKQGIIALNLFVDYYKSHGLELPKHN